MIVTPAIVWGAFAVFGIFIFGALVGSATTSEPAHENPPFLERQESYDELIVAYEELTDLFLYQNQDAEIMSDPEMIINFPEEADDAYRSYQQKRDEIIFQAGRISELRKNAGLNPKESL